MNTITDTIDQIQWIIFMLSKKRELPEQLRNHPEILKFSEYFCLRCFTTFLCTAYEDIGWKYYTEILWPIKCMGKTSEMTEMFFERFVFLQGGYVLPYNF